MTVQRGSCTIWNRKKRSAQITENCIEDIYGTTDDKMMLSKANPRVGKESSGLHL